MYVPTVEDEAMRDLTRAREDVVKAYRIARQVLLAFLLRHGKRYGGATYWSKAHWNWIGSIKMPHRAQQIALQEYVHAIHEQKARVERLTEQIREEINQWQLAPLVSALQSLRGVSLIVAATTVAELGDLTRFQSAKQLMAYLGLVPSEHSSGNTVKRGPITKTGNSHVRRALTEAAHAYRYEASRNSCSAGPAGRIASGSPRYFMEGPGPSLWAIQKAHGQRKKSQHGYHSNCQGTSRFHVGYCSRTQADMRSDLDYENINHNQTTSDFKCAGGPAAAPTSLF